MFSYPHTIYIYVDVYLYKIPGYHIREIKCTYSNGYTAVNTLQLTNKQMHLFTKIPLFISCRHNATLQGNTSQLNKQMPGLFTICFNPSLNTEAIMSNAPNKHLHLLAIAALHLTLMYSSGQTTHQARVAAMPAVSSGPTSGRLNCSGKCRRPESTVMKKVDIKPMVLTQVMPKPCVQALLLLEFG